MSKSADDVLSEYELEKAVAIDAMAAFLDEAAVTALTAYVTESDLTEEFAEFLSENFARPGQQRQDDNACAAFVDGEGKAVEADDGLRRDTVGRLLCDECDRPAVLVIDRDIKAITGYYRSGDAIEECVDGGNEARLCRACADHRDSRWVPQASWEVPPQAETPVEP